MKFSLKSKEFKIPRNPHTTHYERTSALSLIARTISLPLSTPSQALSLSLSAASRATTPSPWLFFLSLVSSSLPRSSLFFFLFSSLCFFYFDFIFVAIRLAWFYWFMFRFLFYLFCPHDFDMLVGVNWMDLVLRQVVSTICLWICIKEK